MSETGHAADVRLRGERERRAVRWCAMTRRLIALAVVLAATAPGVAAAEPASGDWFTQAPVTGRNITDLPISQAAMLAAWSYWGVRGRTVCRGVQIYVATTPPEGGMWAAAGVCRVVVNAAAWRGYRDWNPVGFCAGVVHEIGHTLNIGHEPDRRSVMHVGGDGLPPGILVPQCQRLLGGWGR